MKTIVEQGWVYQGDGGRFLYFRHGSRWTRFVSDLFSVLDFLTRHRFCTTLEIARIRYVFDRTTEILIPLSEEKWDEWLDVTRPGTDSIIV